MRQTSGLPICAVLALSLSVVSASAQSKYDVGATDAEVKIGQTMPYSGPASVLGIEGRVQAAYFEMVNDKGGINGRKVNFISLDDAYSPPKTFEQTRRLVEQDGVLATMGSLGTPTNVAIRKYLNQKKVPQLLVLSSSAQWNNPSEYPYSTSYYLAADQEAASFAKYLKDKMPNAKIAILYQNDDYGKDWLRGFKEGLGKDAGERIVKELSYEATDPTVDSQVLAMKAAGADVFIAAATTKFAAMSIRKISEMQWKPDRFLAAGAISSLKAILDPEIAKGIVSLSFIKDPNDPAVENEPDGKEYFAFMKKYAPNDNAKDMSAVLGYTVAELSAYILEKSGNALTRDNVLKVATALKNPPVHLLQDGVIISTSPDNYLPVTTARLVEFDGTAWIPFGDPVAIRSSKAE
jgi:ABC-type branched-subunit amino acid transport system substrate-binding protein